MEFLALITSVLVIVLLGCCGLALVVICAMADMNSQLRAKVAEWEQWYRQHHQRNLP